MAPLKGAPQAIRRLGTEGVRIRVITHRLVVRHFHETAVAQTVRWLDGHGIPYWDLCFMRDKGQVGADLYVEDSPDNIAKLQEQVGAERVLILSNSTNLDVPGDRAENWEEAEGMIRDRYYAWLDERGLERPPGIGLEPDWAKSGPKPAV
jgi:uncharacterized HAD superfamily protein